MAEPHSLFICPPLMPVSDVYTFIPSCPFFAISSVHTSNVEMTYLPFPAWVSSFVLFAFSLFFLMIIIIIIPPPTLILSLIALFLSLSFIINLFLFVCFFYTSSLYYFVPLLFRSSSLLLVVAYEYLGTFTADQVIASPLLLLL